MMNKLMEKLDNSILETVLNSDWSVYEYITFFETARKSLVKTDYRKPSRPLISNSTFDIDKILKMLNDFSSLTTWGPAYKEVETIETETINAAEIIENAVKNNVLDDQKKLEIASLFARANNDIDEVKLPEDNRNSEFFKNEQENSFLDMTAAVIQANNEIIKSLEGDAPVPKDKFKKQKEWNILKGQWKDVKKLLDAKLPKSIIQYIAYSNPLTAIVAQNWDLVSRK